MNGNLSPWNITPERFPANARIEKKLKFLLRYAILAPSGHNSQPWKFRIRDNKVEFYPDYSRTRQGVDPDNRELFISLGCALANMETAATYFGFGCKVNILGKGMTNPAIVVELNKVNKKMDSGAFESITKRLTSRDRFENKEIDSKIIGKLIQAGQEPGIKILAIEKMKERNNLAELIKKSVKIWYRSRKMVEELQKWTEDKNGLPIEALNLADISEDLEYFWKEDNDKAELKAEKDYHLFSSCPLMLVFLSRDNSVESWIRTGRAYERMALEATRVGLKNGFSTSITEIEETRNELKKYLDSAFEPQFIIRLGYGKEGKHTPRRSINEVIID